MKQREPARRLFSVEFNVSDMALPRDPNDQYAPAYVLSPTGCTINRVLVCGVLLEVCPVGDGSLVRAMVSDPVGSFVVMAGEYQQDAYQALKSLSCPCRVAVVGKPHIYNRDDGVEVSIRAESVNVIEECDVRQWNRETYDQTKERLEHVPEQAVQHYDESTRVLISDALEKIREREGY